jgi:hypothetical protein
MAFNNGKGITRSSNQNCLVRLRAEAHEEEESAHGFNPKTQQKIKIPAKTLVKIRVAKAAKDGVLGVKKFKELYPGKPKHFVLLDR